MARFLPRTARLALLGAALVAAVSVLLLRDGGGAPEADSPSILRARDAPGAGHAVDLQPVALPASVRRDGPQPLEPALEPGWARVPVGEDSSGDARFDDEIYGRVFIARLRDAAGNTPVDLQISASVLVLDEPDEKAEKSGAVTAAARATEGLAIEEILDAGVRPSPQPIALHRASPDPDGLWRWPIDDALGHAALRVTLEFSLGPWRDVSLVTDGRADEVLDVRLPAAASLHGRFDPGSMALTGDDVRLSARWSWTDERGGRWSGSATSSVDEQHYRFDRNLLGHADVTLEVGDAWAQALGPVPSLLSPGVDVLWDIRCDELTDIIVQVVDAVTQAPLPEARVTLRSRRGGSAMAWYAGPDGCARFIGVELAARSPITVTCQDFVPSVIAAPERTEARPMRVVVSLHRGVQVPGQLVDIEGRGVPGATVWLERNAGGQWTGAITDDAGRFTLEQASPGRSQLLGCAVEGFGTSTFPIDITAGMAPQRFTLLAASQLTVQVQRADGRPADGGMVSVLPLGQVTGESIRILDSKGRVDFDALNLQGSVLVTAHGHEPADGVASRIVQLLPGTSQELLLVLAQPPPRDGGLPSVRVELNAFDPRAPEPLSAPLSVKISSAVAGGTALDTRLVQLEPSERSITLPRGLLRLDLIDPAGTWAATRLILDTTALADGTVIDAVLMDAP